MKEVKKVVLIGASGFVGSALLNETLNRGFEVTAVVRHPEKIKIENENLKVTKADVSSLKKYTKFVKGRMPLSVHLIRDGIIPIYMMRQLKSI